MTLSKYVKKFNVTIKLYADDIKVFKAINRTINDVLKLQNCLTEI